MLAVLTWADSSVLSLFLFYAVILLLGATAIMLFLAVVLIPVVLMFRRFGLAAGTGYAIVTAIVVFIGGRMSYGNLVTIEGADEAMNELMIRAQLLNTVPTALIKAGLLMSVIGFTLLLAGRFARRT